MNAIRQAQAGYGQNAQMLKTPRRTEYDAFARITQALCAVRSRDPATFPDLARALHDNRRLWTVLAADVAAPENALPDELRQAILSLSVFVQRHSEAVLSSDADPEPLIDINMSIMAGLRDQGVGP